jgi:hypothetical protein
VFTASALPVGAGVDFTATRVGASGIWGAGSRTNSQVLHPADVPELCHSISIISPITAIIRLDHIPTAPKIVVPAPLLLAVGPELLEAVIIFVTPPVPIVLSIVNRLALLR